MSNEPVLKATTITGAVTAVLVLLVSFGVDLSDDQQKAILGVVAVVAPLVVSFVRSKVTPVFEVEDYTGPDEDVPPDTLSGTH